MPRESNALKILDLWYGSLDLYQDKLPSKGTIAAALIVLQRLRASYDLEISAHVAGGEAQITGLSATSLKRVLAEFGETRTLSSVGGRSNRGARGDIASLLEAMRALRLQDMADTTRNAIIKAMQHHIVANYVSLYFKLKKVKATFDPGAATWRFINGIIENAAASGKAGAVAEHLVGAKLSLRFPDKTIRNKPFTTSDAQGGHAGDFEIGGTAFHVTIAPMAELFRKCQTNLDRGMRVYLLVPGSLVVGTRQNANLQASGRIAVESIESFIATNVDELSEFDGEKLVRGFRRLLEAYNNRVEEVELDKSLLIEIPPNLA